MNSKSSRQEPVIPTANSHQVGGQHYKGHGEVEHWDFSWANNYDQFQYCITKYVHRHKYKGGIEDLKKARHHLDKYIEVLMAELPNHTP